MTSHEEFVERRRHGIGGSDIAAIIGLSKYRTALDVYLQKRGLTESDDDARKEMGRYMEAPILQWYIDSQKVEPIARSEFVRHPEHDFLLGNIDMEVRNEHGDEWGADAKNVHFRAVGEWGDEGSDEMPLDALFQAHHYMFLKPRWSKIDFVVLRGGFWPPRIYTVRRDDELYAALVLSRLIAFWTQHVIPGIPPTPDFADEKTIASIKALYVPIDEKGNPPIVLPATVTVGENAVPVEDLAEAYDLLGKLEKEAGTRRKKVEAALRSVLADDRAGIAGEIEIKRIYNKGGYRPATEIAPYDYLRLTFPKTYEKRITAARIAGLLGESNG